MRLEDQDAIAPAGSFGNADDLMAAVSSAARTVSWQFDRAWHAVARSAKEPAKPRPLASGVTLRNGEVELGVDVSPELDPTLMLQLAVGAARTESPIATRALETLNDRTPEWPSPWPTGATHELVALLLEGPRAIPVLESLDQAELFSRMLPGVGAGSVSSATQRVPPVHRRSPSVGGSRAGRASRRPRRQARPVGDRRAAARHRQGVSGGSHRTWRRARRGDRPTDGLRRTRLARTSSALVRHHLLLPDIATRRDLDDPATIDMVAEAVRNVRRSSTSCTPSPRPTRWRPVPPAWSPWKAELVEELVERVRMRLGVGDGAESGHERGSPFPNADVLALMGAGETAMQVDGAADRRRQPRPPRHVRPTGGCARVARHRCRRSACAQ